MSEEGRVFEMRDEVFVELVEKTFNDPQFREKAKQDPEGALREHGYELEPQELEAVKEFHAQAAGMTEEEMDRQLARNVRWRQFRGGSGG